MSWMGLDGSVKHIVIYDHINGGVLEELGGQGFAEGSSWSRGQSWGLYGFVLSYIHTGKEVTTRCFDKNKDVCNTLNNKLTD